MISDKVTTRIDADQFYFGYDYRINDKLVLHQPTVKEMIDIGISRYYQILHLFTTIPYDHMSELWDNGVDFTKISDMEFFIMMLGNSLSNNGIESEKQDNIHKIGFDLFFGDIGFNNIELCKREDEFVLFNKNNGVIFDVDAYKKVSQCLCLFHGIKKERFRPAGRRAKQEMINLDRQEKLEKAKQTSASSSFLPLISSVLNHPGYKYTREETLQLNVFFFMDCVSRIRLKDSVDNLAIGYYTGSLDSKKFKPEKQLNWMKDLYE